MGLFCLLNIDYEMVELDIIWIEMGPLVIFK